MKKLLLSIAFASAVFLIGFPTQAHAQDWGGCVETITDFSGTTAQVATLRCLPIVFSNIVNAALMFVGAVAVILIVYAGIIFIRSGGDAKQVQHARQIITYAIIGLVLVLCSFGIIFLISYLTGAKCIETMSLTSCQ